MRKLIMCLSVLAGLLFAGTLPASANAAAGLTAMKVDASSNIVTEARWHGRRGWGHRGWGHRGWRRRGWGGFYGFGLPLYYGYGYYPRYYYDDYYGGYGGYYGYRRYHRGWGHRRYYGGHRGHWRGHRGHWGGHRGGWGHRGGGHHRH